MIKKNSIFALVTGAFGDDGGIAQVTRDTLIGLSHLPDIEQIEILPRHARHSAGMLPSNVRQHPPHPDRVAFTAAALGRGSAFRPAIVYCNHLYMAPLAAFLARRAGATLMVHLHGIEIWNQPTPARRRALERADLVLCSSRDTRTRAIGFADLPPERLVVVNCCASAGFSVGDRKMARRKFGWNDGEAIVLTVSRLSASERYKGQDRIIRMLADIQNTRKVTYIVAGDGDDADRLKSLAMSVGADRFIRFLGQVASDDLPDLYRSADLFAMPSTGEGFGIAFVEAMACGTPAIGLAVGGARDALADGELGWCVAEHNFAGAFSAAVSSARPDPDHLASQVAARFGVTAFEDRLAKAIDLL